jgi:hypothetical protein
VPPHLRRRRPGHACLKRRLPLAPWAGARHWGGPASGRRAARAAGDRWRRHALCVGLDLLGGGGAGLDGRGGHDDGRIGRGQALPVGVAHARALVAPGAAVAGEARVLAGDAGAADRGRAARAAALVVPAARAPWQLSTPAHLAQRAELPARAGAEHCSVHVCLPGRTAAAASTPAAHTRRVARGRWPRPSRCRRHAPHRAPGARRHPPVEHHVAPLAVLVALRLGAGQALPVPAGGGGGMRVRERGEEGLPEQGQQSLQAGQRGLLAQLAAPAATVSCPQCSAVQWRRRSPLALALAGGGGRAAELAEHRVAAAAVGGLHAGRARLACREGGEGASAQAQLGRPMAGA